MIYKFIISCVFFIAFYSSYGQANSPAHNLAQFQAQKMKDTLCISENMRQQIYIVNLDISNRKQQARIQYASDPREMKIEIQFYENQRDSIYQTILMSPLKYQLYKNKKKNILSAH